MFIDNEAVHKKQASKASLSKLMEILDDSKHRSAGAAWHPYLHDSNWSPEEIARFVVKKTITGGAMQAKINQVLKEYEQHGIIPEFGEEGKQSREQRKKNRGLADARKAAQWHPPLMSGGHTTLEPLVNDDMSNLGLDCLSKERFEYYSHVYTATFQGADKNKCHGRTPSATGPRIKGKPAGTY